MHWTNPVSLLELIGSLGSKNKLGSPYTQVASDHQDYYISSTHLKFNIVPERLPPQKESNLQAGFNQTFDGKNHQARNDPKENYENK